MYILIVESEPRHRDLGNAKRVEAQFETEPEARAALNAYQFREREIKASILQNGDSLASRDN